MKILFRAIPWLILLISFAILACFYNSLPDEVLIARSFFGNTNIIASKSLFTVFRVPLIEMVCALAIEIMRRSFVNENANFSLMWNILLYTVSLKSLFQSFEMVFTKDYADVFFYITLGVVLAGIITALSVGRKILSKSSRTAGNLSRLERTILVFLLFCYLGLAIVPTLVFK